MANKKIINTRYHLTIFIIVVLASGWIGVFIDSFFLQINLRVTL